MLIAQPVAVHAKLVELRLAAEELLLGRHLRKPFLPAEAGRIEQLPMIRLGRMGGGV